MITFIRKLSLSYIIGLSSILAMESVDSNGIQKITDHLYQFKATETCFMYMERITLDNEEKWCRYKKRAYEALFDLYPEKKDETQEETRKFNHSKDAINHFGLQICTDNVWVCFATDTNQIDKNSDDWMSHIEMSFAVSIDPNHKIPFTNHMGIFRNPLYILKKFGAHKAISLPLHALGALVSIEVENPIRSPEHQLMYMVNAPQPAMREIFINSLNEGDYQSGDDGPFIKMDYGHNIISILNSNNSYDEIIIPTWLNTGTRLFVVPLNKLSTLLKPQVDTNLPLKKVI